VGLAVARQRSARALAAAAVVVAVGAALIAANDAHGVPILCGLVIGAALAMVSPPREPARTGPRHQVNFAAHVNSDRATRNAVSLRGNARFPLRTVCRLVSACFPC
jgi:hypothetical protein